MVQLRVEDGSNYVFLDLYETEPIKLTLSIEDIETATTKSVFSRTFRVPSTGKNNRYFKHAFVVEGVDFDVTVRKPATVLIDGSEFRQGHVRLQKIFVNKANDTIDYEIVFLGETRDFATALSDKKLKDLDLSQYDHDRTYTNIVNSWQAYPEGSLTDGLFNGDILYPLVDFGDTEGAPRVKYSKNQNGGGFNFSANALQPSFFRPMIRAKALWDKIFEEAGFTYTSNIANNEGFTQLYVSAWGNDPDNPVEVDGSANHLDVALTGDYYVSGTDTILWNVENLDPNNNYNPNNGRYVVPETSDSGLGNIYQINVRVGGVTRGETGGGSVIVRLKKNSTVLDTTSHTIPADTQRRWLSLLSFTTTVGNELTAGDIITVEVEEAGDVDRTLIELDSYFVIPRAAGELGLSEFFDDEYKQIDFIKDMISKFRLVLAPDRNNNRNFIVETWNDYIGQGDLYDWTDKVDHNKDFQIEPVFFAQTDRIRFEDKEDKDMLNDRNFNKFKEQFGTLIFDSGNDLLIGERKQETGFAPTPLMQIDGAKDSNFLIPKIYNAETEQVDEDNQGNPIFELIREPIKPVTRLLFYNGLITQSGTDDFGVTMGDWYLESGSPQAQDQFPMISYWQYFDPITGPSENTLNLNWQIERGYANDFASVNFTAGIGMFDQFWAQYISDIYNKFARKVTCHVVLEPVDILTFSFDDVIFIDGTYYRPEKIIDVVVGERSVAKVELVKLFNYQLQQAPEALELAGPENPIDGPLDGGGDQPVGGGGGQPVGGGDQQVGDSQLRHYTMELCDNPSLSGDNYRASYTSANPLPAGTVVKISPFNSCWTILEQTVVPPSDPTEIIGIFPDCLSCNE
jgi:hypothetical protein